MRSPSTLDILDIGQEMRNKKSPLISLTGFGGACFYAYFFTLCQAGMPNVLEENRIQGIIKRSLN